MESKETCPCPIPLCSGEMSMREVIELKNGLEIKRTEWVCEKCGYKHKGARPLLV